MTRRRPPLSDQDRADLRADRARMYGGEVAPTERPGGVLAMHDGFCWSCDRQIVRLQSRVVPRKGSLRVRVLRGCRR